MILCALSTRSWKASANATNFTRAPAALRIAWTAADIPRPPHPISAILISSLPAAWTGVVGASVPATARAEEAFRKLRRDGRASAGEFGLFITQCPAAGASILTMAPPSIDAR
jgi:hypothetical protein